MNARFLRNPRTRSSVKGGFVASYAAIAAVGESVVRFLRGAFVSFPGGAPQVEQITSTQLLGTGSGSSPINTLLGTISLLLYRVDVDGVNRNPTSSVRPVGGGPVQLRYSLPLDLRYLLTSWADQPDRQQLVLGKAMSVLEGHRTFAGAALVNQVGDGSTVWSADDSFQFIPDELGTEDLYQIWESLGRSFELSVPYKARVVRIDPDVAENDLPVLERDLVYGRAVPDASDA
jgi:hypothetical protein